VTSSVGLLCSLCPRVALGWLGAFGRSGVNNRLPAAGPPSAGQSRVGSGLPCSPNPCGEKAPPRRQVGTAPMPVGRCDADSFLSRLGCQPRWARGRGRPAVPLSGEAPGQASSHRPEPRSSPLERRVTLGDQHTDSEPSDEALYPGLAWQPGRSHSAAAWEIRRIGRRWQPRAQPGAAVLNLRTCNRFSAPDLQDLRRAPPPHWPNKTSKGHGRPGLVSGSGRIERDRDAWRRGGPRQSFGRHSWDREMGADGCSIHRSRTRGWSIWSFWMAGSPTIWRWLAPADQFADSSSRCGDPYSITAATWRGEASSQLFLSLGALGDQKPPAAEAVG